MKEYFNLKGRVAIVTGCSGGLGVQMARALASAGCNIVPIARRMEKLEEVAAALRADFGVEALPLRCDITSTEQVNEVVDKALEHFGRIDILVNNAGTGAVAPAEAITDAQFENEMQIDLFGSFRVARAVAAKAMIPAGFGRIINIASMYGLVGNKIAPASPYHAAKGGVVNLSRALAAEWGKYETCHSSRALRRRRRAGHRDTLPRISCLVLCHRRCPSGGRRLHLRLELLIDEKIHSFPVGPAALRGGRPTCL